MEKKSYQYELSIGMAQKEHSTRGFPCLAFILYFKQGL
jgi:hypothetical protein